MYVFSRLMLNKKIKINIKKSTKDERTRESKIKNERSKKKELTMKNKQKRNCHFMFTLHNNNPTDFPIGGIKCRLYLFICMRDLTCFLCDCECRCTQQWITQQKLKKLVKGNKRRAVESHCECRKWCQMYHYWVCGQFYNYGTGM